MEEILRNPRYRRMFFIVAGLVAIVILFCRFFLLPSFDVELSISRGAFFAAVLDNLFSTLVVTVAIGTFVFWFTPRIMPRAKLEAVEPRDIGRLLRSAAENANEWWFRGGLGRYTRSITLRTMASGARSQNLRRRITIEIIDPDDHAVCAKYARYRQGLRSASKGGTTWTEESVRIELFATILAAYIVKAQDSMMDVTVVLSAWYSSFRLDLSSLYVVVTKEDPAAPAMRCDTGTYFYDAYRDDVVLTASQGRRLGNPPIDFDPQALTPNVVRSLFVHLGLDTTGVELERVIEKAKDSRNPYG